MDGHGEGEILKENFHIMQDDAEEKEEKNVEVMRCASNPFPSGAIGEGVAIHSNLLHVCPLGQGNINETQSED